MKIRFVLAILGILVAADAGAQCWYCTWAGCASNGASGYMNCTYAPDCKLSGGCCAVAAPAASVSPIYEETDLLLVTAAGYEMGGGKSIPLQPAGLDRPYLACSGAGAVTIPVPAAARPSRKAQEPSMSLVVKP